MVDQNGHPNFTSQTKWRPFSRLTSTCLRDQKIQVKAYINHASIRSTILSWQAAQLEKYRFRLYQSCKSSIFCSAGTNRECVDKVIHKLEKDHQTCQCQVPCSAIEYETSYLIAKFPPRRLKKGENQFWKMTNP